MECFINGTVKYNSDDGSLIIQGGTDNIITLSRVCNELFILFISHAGKPLTREFILNELWLKKGLNASGNNLTNYVSVLRKSLAGCGLTDIISTIPKYGFVFEGIITKAESPGRLQQKSAPPSELSVLSSEASSAGVRLPSTFVISRKLKISVFVLALVAAGLVPYIYDQLRLNTIRNEVFSLDQCRFYLIDDTTRRLDKNLVEKRITSIVLEENFNCKLQANVYFSADQKRNISGGFVFHDILSYCPWNSTAPCVNYIYIRNEIENKNENKR